MDNISKVFSFGGNLVLLIASILLFFQFWHLSSETDSNPRLVYDLGIHHGWMWGIGFMLIDFAYADRSKEAMGRRAAGTTALVLRLVASVFFMCAGLVRMDINFVLLLNYVGVAFFTVGNLSFLVEMSTMVRSPFASCNNMINFVCDIVLFLGALLIFIANSSNVVGLGIDASDEQSDEYPALFDMDSASMCQMTGALLLVVGSLGYFALSVRDLISKTGSSKSSNESVRLTGPPQESF